MKLGGGREWFTAAELAAFALPGLGNVKRRINELAAAERWALAVDARGNALARKRQARGGGTEYHVAVLPAAARAALGMNWLAEVADVSATAPDVATMTAQQLWRWYDAAGDRVQTAAQRRLAIVQQVETFEEIGMTRSAAIGATAKQFGVGKSSIWTYLGLIDGVAVSDRLVHLAPRPQGGGSEAEVDPEAWRLLLSDYLRPEQPTFSSCYWRLSRDYAAPRGLTLPTERTLRRKLEREVDQRLVVYRRQGEEASRRSLPSQRRSVAELHALEWVNIDGHKFDVFVRWEDGRIGRPIMIALQDIYSRKFVAHRIDETENMLATRLAFADLFRDYGIPKHCTLDNGRAFASKGITGGAKTRFRFKIREEEPTGLLTALGIKTHFALPFRGQSKPIERAFKDLCDTIARAPVCAGAYTGNSVDAKPENYGDRAIPIAEFRLIAAAGIAAHNAKMGRRTETARGRSFDVAFAESYATAPIGKATPEQLRMALLTAEERTCDRRTSEVSLAGNRYWSEALSAHAGKKLVLRFDPENLHSEVYVYDRQGAFLCVAPILATTGFGTMASAGESKAREAQLRRQMRDLERLHDLVEAEALAAMMPAHIDEADVPVPAVVRPVRHRGQVKAALKPVSEASQVPLNPVIDRLAGIGLRLVG